MGLYNNGVWFGTENNMQWVPAPAANYTATNVRWRATDLFLNGGAAVRQSTASHKELSLSWPVQSQEALAPLVSTLQQAGPFYYLDPINGASNAVPSYWAQPGMVQDGPPLVQGVEPNYTPSTGGESLGYPTTAWNTTVAGTTKTAIKIPIPSGYAAYVGVHGTGPGVIVNGITMSYLSVTSSTTVHPSAVPTGNFVEISLPSGNHNISGIVVQVLPSGQEPINGPFLPGVGHSALQLNGDPTVTNYSVAIPQAQTGIAADFIEVGSWL